MSCRVYTGAAQLQRVTWPSCDTPPLSAFAATSTSEPGNHVEESFRRKIAELQQEAEIRVQQAHTTGVLEGRKFAEAEIAAAMQRAANTVAELSGVRSKLRKEAEADLVKLTMAVAQRILRRELTVDAEALQGIVHAAIEKLNLRDQCTVRVFPAHAQLVRRVLENVGAASINIVADNALQPGDLLFDTSRGTLDASLQSQLNEIERGFADVLGR